MEDQNELYKNIFASLIDGVVLVGRDGLIMGANVSAEEMFQQSTDSFVGKSVAELLPAQPDILSKIRQTAETGVSFRDVECLGFRKSNIASFPVNLTLSPLLSVAGQSQGAIVLARDMTLLKELEGTSRQMDHIANLRVLSLGMAHEIKNPLAAIGGSAQLLRDRIDSAEHKEFLDVVIAETARINRMVERLLGLARPGKLAVKSVNIHKVLGDILALEKKALRGKIDFEQLYDPSLPSVEADEDQLKQVFLNLIRNALEAMRDGGKLSMATRICSNYSVKAKGCDRPRHDIIIEITDTGEGISEEHLKNLFTPFYTTKSKGNGLGLPISLKIIEDHQGAIKVSSHKGKGTTVLVYLPVRQGKL